MESFLARYMPLNASAHGGALDSMNAIVHWLMAEDGWTLKTADGSFKNGEINFYQQS